jgi:hypothetical protein
VVAPRQPGNLADGQRLQLHVAGVMTEFTKRLAAHIEHPVIRGVTADGKLVTLFGGTETGGQMQLFSETVGETIVTAPRAYIGNHFDTQLAVILEAALLQRELGIDAS